MYTEEFRLRGILSPRVGRPVHNEALKATPPSTPRPSSQRNRQFTPRLPELDGRSVRGAPRLRQRLQCPRARRVLARGSQKRSRV